jgi:hypothetical protein
MPKFITVSHLVETDGGGMGVEQGTLGWFADHAAAVAGSHLLGHGFYNIRDNVPAMQMDDGAIYILRMAEPVRHFGLVRR